MGRISMTIAPDVLEAADRLAGRWGRSRSWVISEALRRLAAQPIESAWPAAVAEPLQNEGFVAVASVKADQLRRTAALSPADRLREAESLVRLGRAARPRHRRAQVVGFATLDDFAQWKKARRSGA